MPSNPTTLAELVKALERRAQQISGAVTKERTYEADLMERAAKVLRDAADEIERLRTAIRTTLALAGCAHLADDHGHQRCDALPADHDGRRHPYTRPRMLDALATAIGDEA